MIYTLFVLFLAFGDPASPVSHSFVVGHGDASFIACETVALSINVAVIQDEKIGPSAQPIAWCEEHEEA